MSASSLLVVPCAIGGLWILWSGYQRNEHHRRFSIAGLDDHLVASGHRRLTIAPIMLIRSGLAAIRLRLRVAAPRTYRRSLDRLLVRAGIQGALAADELLVAQGITAALGGLVGLMYMRLGLPGSGIGVLVLGACVLAGALGPYVVVRRTARRRESTIVGQFPDFLDLMALSVGAGLAFDVAMAEVARQIRGPLAQELDQVTTSVALGQSRADALDAFDHKLGLPDVSSFVLAVNQAAELGAPIGSTLENQAGSARVRRRQLEEERINTLPVKILVPTVLFILPPTLLVVLGPAMSDILGALS